VVASLSLVAGGGGRAPAAGPLHHAAHGPPPHRFATGRFALPGANAPTLSEIFAVNVRDAGWMGFVLPQLPQGQPLLWVQDRMAVLEAGRLYAPGLGAAAAHVIHVAARDAREALWAMEEGLRCSSLGAVIGEMSGDPAALDFTATRRLAVAAERHGVAALLIRLGGHANLSGARLRWRVGSSPSLPHRYDPKAPGAPVWDAELFRARGHPPGRWRLCHEAADGGAEAAFHLVAEHRDRALGEDYAGTG
jgi:protein ImuA